MARTITASLVGWLVAAAMAPAQTPYTRPQTGPLARPALSPYLNLFRVGNPAINYYGLVRPQQEFGTSIQDIQNQMNAPHPAMTGPDGGAALPITGHPSRFFSHQSYFFTHLGTNSGGTRTPRGVPTPGTISARPGQPASGSGR